MNNIKLDQSDSTYLFYVYLLKYCKFLWPHNCYWSLNSQHLWHIVATQQVRVVLRWNWWMQRWVIQWAEPEVCWLGAGRWTSRSIPCLGTGWWATGNPMQNLRYREMKFPRGSREMGWEGVPGERGRLGWRVGWREGSYQRTLWGSTGVATWGRGKRGSFRKADYEIGKGTH